MMQENVSLWLTCMAIWLDENEPKGYGPWWVKWWEALPGRYYLDSYDLERVIDEH